MVLITAPPCLATVREMALDELIRLDVADIVVKLGRAFEIGEQDGQAAYVQFQSRDQVLDAI
jgi:hypothetical protein